MHALLKRFDRRQLTDHILESLTGLSFIKLATAIEDYHEKLAGNEDLDTEPADGASPVEQPDLSQENLEESAAMSRYPRTASHGVGRIWSGN